VLDLEVDPNSQLVSQYLDRLGQRSTLESLSQFDSVRRTLDLSSIKVIKSKFTREFLIVNTITSKPGVGKALFIKDDQVIIKANVFYFSDVTGYVDFDNLISKFVENESHTWSGRVDVYSLYGKLNFFNVFQNGEIETRGVVLPRTGKRSEGRTNGCIDWYLITTIRYTNGTSSTFEQYVGTTCDCDQNTTRSASIMCGGGGDGGGSGQSLPSSPQQGDQFSITNPSGVYRVMEYHCFDYGCIWEIIYTQLPELVVEANRSEYAFLPLNPFDGQVIVGSDGLVYEFNGQYNSWTGGSDTHFGIDCASFAFRQTSSNWQESKVGGLHFTVRVLDASTGYTYSRTLTISRPVWFGLPIERFDGTVYSSGQAAEIAASAVQYANDLTHALFVENPALPVSTAESVWLTHLKSKLLMDGGRADFVGSGSPNVIFTEATYAIIGNGNCN